MSNNQETDDAWNRINIYDGPEVFLQTFAEVSAMQGLLFAATFAQSEICNGGFRQFFSNSTGVLAPEAIRAFAEIGMPLTGAIVQQACTLMGEPYPRDRTERQRRLLLFSKDAFREFENRFFSLLEAENGGFELAAQSLGQSN